MTHRGRNNHSLSPCRLQPSNSLYRERPVTVFETYRPYIGANASVNILAIQPAFIAWNIPSINTMHIYSLGA
jgi:hypothetical protein